LLFALTLLNECPYPSQQRTIDVSGDGRNNMGFPVRTIRGRVGGLGVTINGLAILNEEPDLLQHYREDVIIGPNAFALEAADYEAFAAAMQQKLVRELTPAAIV
jgi:hypothetical protein